MKPGKLYSLDSVAGLLAGFLVLSIGVVIWLGSQMGIRVTPQFSTGNTVGPFGPLTLGFSEPVDEFLVTDTFYTDPEVEGTFTLVDEKTLQFVPTEPFQPGITYELGLEAGPLTKEGLVLKKSKSWKFRVRPPLVAYLVAAADRTRLWTVDPETGKTNPLTDDYFKIFDFDTSRDGEFVIFSAFNSQQGIDLWRVSRSGTAPVLLLQCGPDRCSVPAISPDGGSVAYVRETVLPNATLQFGSPHIWLLNIEARQDAPLYEDKQILGYQHTWSPDGTYIASFDGLSNQIHLLDLATSEHLIIPSKKGSTVTWSEDGSTFVYMDVKTDEKGSRTWVREADLVTGETTTLFGEKDDRDYYYNSLAWSPVADALVIGLRSEEDSSAELLWLIDPATREGPTIASQPDTVYNTPAWDPWGKGLVFQQFNLRGAYKPEINIWKPGMQTPKVVAEGIMAHWLP
jgi:dipeptidyl aminopeptidase/acylaminoacyl peptidase